MADKARKATDKQLAKMERHLTEIYLEASADLTEKAEKYFKQFEKLDAQKKQLVEDGKLTEQEYKEWRQNKVMTGKRWTALKEQSANALLNADKTAMAYINDKLPDIYALNYNGVAGDLNGTVKGISFELVDASTVKNLSTSDKTLLPYKTVDNVKAERWHTKTVNAEVLQGILQGESMPKIAKRLENVGMTAKGSAIRNARTSVTSAENKGRMDMLHEAEEKGVVVHKVWLATHDGRVRDSHLDLDGEEREIDEPFENVLVLSKTRVIDDEIMYPGDPNANPANTYNCRCSLSYKVVGFKGG